MKGKKFTGLVTHWLFGWESLVLPEVRLASVFVTEVLKLVFHGSVLVRSIQEEDHVLFLKIIRVTSLIR